MQHVVLNNGLRMPLLGFGVFQITDEAACDTSKLWIQRDGFDRTLAAFERSMQRLGSTTWDFTLTMRR